jgi:HD-like signal output (HDOD) protein
MERVSRVSPNYGRGTHTIEIEELDSADPDNLKIKLLSIFKSPDYKPPVLPEVAIDLVELTRKQNVSYEDVIKLLERDPIVASDVLRAAQSPLYASRTPVRSLADAVNRLGIATLREIVWQIALNLRLFRVKGYTAPMKRLQAHSVCTAHIARLIAGHAGVAAEQAFLCGLLHDVGISGTLIALSEAGPKAPPALDMLWPGLDRMHTEASGMMTRLWGLSPEVCAVVGQHHPQGARSNFANPLVAVICLAESLAEEADCGIGTKDSKLAVDQNLPSHIAEAAKRLNVERKLEGIRSQAHVIASKLAKAG